jgi:hypothetical protein
VGAILCVTESSFNRAFLPSPSSKRRKNKTFEISVTLYKNNPSAFFQSARVKQSFTSPVRWFGFSIQTETTNSLPKVSKRAVEEKINKQSRRGKTF